ncbi:hypothetical protein TWF694_006633 [Orbilia ellipsospora]|uniref:Uncharacterized protein n=1 Tax=Orbilia ellipsospora TaxID=2528407 RepID=A0AAV9XSF2_9PEZI
MNLIINSLGWVGWPLLVFCLVGRILEAFGTVGSVLVISAETCWNQLQEDFNPPLTPTSTNINNNSNNNNHATVNINGHRSSRRLAGLNPSHGPL